MMTLKRLSVSAAILAASVAAAAAAERFVYQEAAFEAALDSGKPILVHVTAPWCPECRLQKPIVAALAARPEYDGLTIFDVDFDTQKDALRRLKVQKQSTLVIYRDRTEQARVAGITRQDAIEAFMRNAR